MRKVAVGRGEWRDVKRGGVMRFESGIEVVKAVLDAILHKGGELVDGGGDNSLR